MVDLELFSQLADKIRFYGATITEIQNDAKYIQIYLKADIITNSQLSKLHKSLKPEYIMTDIDFLSKEITFEKVNE